jgi:hypothetical protein
MPQWLQVPANLGLRKPSVEVLPFPLSCCLPFGGRVGLVRQLDDCRPLPRSFPLLLLLFSSLPRPHSYSSRRIELELAKFLAISSGVVAIRVKSTFLTLQVGSGRSRCD